ncbi:hypothetical protein [Desulfonatronum thiosulfatophilum]|uniref:hypothetical protein n=1 Tax=Desulfonatronum thiosulfatophilum TaxID=617002 RepID=UPI0011145C77|nr:hypothetical protein [Desulfonatronum thiosulfatophilum]
MFRIILTSVFVLLSLFLSGCGGGSDDESYESHGTAPVIVDVGITPTPLIEGKTATLQIGEYYFISMHVFDPDLDVVSFRITSNSENSETPSDILKFPLEKQTSPDKYYASIVYIEGPIGNWRTTVQVYDAKGNASRPLHFDIVVISADSEKTLQISTDNNSPFRILR